MKRPPSASLSTHIMLVVLLASCVALAVFTCASLVFSRMASTSQLDSRLATLADVIGQNSSAALNFNDREAAASVLEALRTEPHVVSACLYDVSGALFAEYRREPSNRHCPGREAAKTAGERGYRDATRPAIHRKEIVGTIRLTSDMRDLNAQEQRLLTIALILAAISLAAGALSGAILQYRVSKPIANLAHAMHKVTSEESFSAHVAIGGSREIAELAVGFNTMLTELGRRDRKTKLADAQLYQQARTDSLTGLPNRRLFSESLDAALAAAQRRDRVLGLLYIDLDGFKLVNDSLGHSIGDILLCEVAKRLRSRVRRSDTLARVGGDEFTVILTTLKAAEDAALAAQALLQCLTQTFRIEGHEIKIGASVGISILKHPQEDGADLLRQADIAMYAAKRRGKNRAVYFSDDLGSMARERLTLENELRGAIERGEIHVHYQPEFDVKSNQLVRYEALARWKHPVLGDIAPFRFIPVAEESGLIHNLGAYIMEEACREALKWQSSSTGPIQVAVNVSVLQFNTQNIVEEIRDILRRTGLRAGLLQVELTESVMMGSLQKSADKMWSLRGLGVSIALDDFGTGYSCLSYLPELPFNSIKLDRSFVSKLSPGSGFNTMIRSMVDLAHSMSMRVIVEGIEEVTQLELVKELGADEVQGYLLGRPGPNPSVRLRLPKESEADPIPRATTPACQA
jgi:diguanylate cyclase (GGDEF)-like protein